MKKSDLTIEELTEEALIILVRELGPLPAARLAAHYNMGRGDYTAERHAWLDDLPLDPADQEDQRDN
ncbi:MAG: hypothetical protein AAF752_12940 [Bacteroidota bacterium]